MLIRNFLRYSLALVALFACAGVAAAQGSCSNCSTVESNLTLSATAETAVKLVISTGASGATVTDGGSGAFTVAFGNVNGLGVGTPTSGVSVSSSASGATYTTPITVTPTFSGFTDTTATVKIYQDSATSAASQSAAREGAAADSTVQPPAVLASATTVTTTAASATGITRYVGVFVSNVNGASKVVGALAPKFIYKVTVP